MGNNGLEFLFSWNRVDDKRGYQGLIMDLANMWYSHSLENVLRYCTSNEFVSHREFYNNG